LNYYQFKQLGLPDNMEPLVFFVGKPATDYDNQPMLQQLNWRQNKKSIIEEITVLHESKCEKVFFDTKRR
jgi:nicotinate-nucleotide--dimethylbenzimidazole phosphoribosyltransferase